MYFYVCMSVCNEKNIVKLMSLLFNKYLPFNDTNIILFLV